MKKMVILSQNLFIWKRNLKNSGNLDKRTGLRKDIITSGWMISLKVMQRILETRYSRTKPKIYRQIWVKKNLPKCLTCNDPVPSLARYCPLWHRTVRFCFWLESPRHPKRPLISWEPSGYIWTKDLAIILLMWDILGRYNLPPLNPRRPRQAGITQSILVLLAASSNFWLAVSRT